MEEPLDPPALPRAGEAGALRAGGAVGERDARALLEVRGVDRSRFVNGYLTCDVNGLAVGRVAYGFFTSREGRVLADVWVAALGEALLLSLPADRVEAIAAHLSRFLLASRVELRPRGELAALHLAGPAASGLLLACGVPAPESDGVESLLRGEESAGETWWVLRRDLGAIPGFELWLPAAERDRQVAALAAAGAARAPAESFELARVEEGVPAYGIDFTEEHFPQETGVEAEAVSYAKGCYLGQEVVARIHYRGGVQRRLYGLRFPGEATLSPPPGTVVLHEGREAGRVTSAALSPKFGAIGLAVLHRRVGDPPARLELAGGGVAELAELPFAALASPAAPLET